MVDEKQCVGCRMERLETVKPIRTKGNVVLTLHQRHAGYAAGYVEIDIIGVAGDLSRAVDDGGYLNAGPQFAVNEGVATKGQHVSADNVTILRCGKEVQRTRQRSQPREPADR